MLQELSYTELLGKIYITYLKAFHCNVKENLNPLFYIPTPQNDINEVNLVSLLKN